MPGKRPRWPEREREEKKAGSSPASRPAVGSVQGRYIKTPGAPSGAFLFFSFPPYTFYLCTINQPISTRPLAVGHICVLDQIQKTSLDVKNRERGGESET